MYETVVNLDVQGKKKSKVKRINTLINVTFSPKVTSKTSQNVFPVNSKCPVFICNRKVTNFVVVRQILQEKNVRLHSHLRLNKLTVVVLYTRYCHS